MLCYIGWNIYFSIFHKTYDTLSAVQQTMETKDEQNRTRVKSGNLSLSTAHHPTHAHTYKFIQHNVELRSKYEAKLCDVKVSLTKSCSGGDIFYERLCNLSLKS